LRAIRHSVAPDPLLALSDPAMLWNDGSREDEVGAKHGFFAQAQENLLQGQRLSVSN
jgi:hypothetical protein